MSTYVPHPDPQPGDLVWVELAIQDTPHRVWVVAQVVDRREDRAEILFDDASCVWLPLDQIRIERRNT